MPYLPENTLAYYNAAPQFHTFDLSQYPVEIFAKPIDDFKKVHDNGDKSLQSPETEAVRFYALNHCASLVRKMFTPNEPLPPWAKKVMDSYLQEITQQGRRMFSYLLCIITRESRHIKGMKEHHPLTMVQAKFGKGFHDFISKMKQTEESSIEKFLEGHINSTIFQYVGGISYCFSHGIYGSGYGGQPWANISDCAHSFLCGKTSLEMLVDTAFTLAHNGGPIFNKGMLYLNYGSKFPMILDIQRGGQMAELVLETQMGNSYNISIPDDIYATIVGVKAALPNEFAGFVNWYTIENLGAVGSYDSYKSKQKKAHPESVEDAEMLAKKIAAEKNIAEPISTGQMEGYFTTHTGDFQVFPGQAVPTFKRVAPIKFSKKVSHA